MPIPGKIVEIINTDAEGRLVLADALAYGRKLEPDYRIDHATLTGACMVALGTNTAGFFTNDEELATRYLDAAKTAGESLWRLPLLEDLRDQLKSDVADLKHTGDRYGGSISAALFLREFVGGAKWAHLDIAGPAFFDRAHALGPKGGTGFGVLAMLQFLASLRAERCSARHSGTIARRFTMSLILLKCSNCGADLNAEGSTQFFRCHYCGKTSLNPSFTAASVAQPVAPVPPTAHVAPPAGTILPAGTRVWAQWSGGSAGRFYPSTVIGFQGGRYHIAWDDGSAPTWEDPPRVMIPTSATPSNAQPGMHVAAMWTNGMHYGARVSQVDPRGLLVAWDDGTPPSWVQFGDVFVPGASAQASGTWSAAQGRFAPGAHVQARWQHGSYYGAVVLAFDGARYQLRWDDGTAPTWVDQSEVQPG